MRVAGFGFRSGATVDSLRSALLLAAGTAPIDAFAAPEDKATAGCLVALAETAGVPLVAVSEAALASVRTATLSPRVLRTRRTGSVAEAAALAAAGDGARLMARRQVSDDRRATCAVAVGGAS